MTGIIPPAKTTFADANGAPLAGGSVAFYAPGTTSPVMTYAGPGTSAAPNPNPVPLDSAGRAVIWGSGSLRQVVQDSTGAVVWDQVTETGGAGVIVRSVMDYGALGNGVADDTAAILACQAAVVADGGGVVFYPPGNYLVSQTINVTVSNVRHIGSGRGGNHDTSPVCTAATTITWIGASGGTIFNVQPLAGTQKIAGWAIEDMALVAGVFPYTVAAGYGAVLSGCQFGSIRVTTIEFGIAAVATTTPTFMLSEAQGTQFNRIDIVARQVNQTGTVLQLGSGEVAGNTCFNRIVRVTAEYSGLGIDFQDCDNNTAEEVFLQYVGSGVGESVYFRGGVAPNNNGFARNNIIEHLSHSVAPSRVFAEGIGTYGPRTTVTASTQNQILFFDSSNEGFDLFLGAGAGLWCGKNTQAVGISDAALGDGYGYKADLLGIYEIWGTLANVGGGTANGVVFPNGLTLRTASS